MLYSDHYNPFEFCPTANFEVFYNVFKTIFLIPLRLEMLYNPKNVYKKFDGPGTSDNSYIEDFLIFLTCFSVGQWPATSGQKNEKTGRPWLASFPKNDKWKKYVTTNSVIMRTLIKILAHTKCRSLNFFFTFTKIFSMVSLF